MKTALLLLVLFFTAGCASKDGFEGESVHACGPGDLVTIEAGVDLQGYNQMENMPARIMILVRVSNNSHEDIEVKFVRIDPLSQDNAVYRIENAYGEFSQVIKEGDDHIFEIPSTGQYMPRYEREVISRGGVPEAAVSVGLANGPVYRCRFALMR
jgi:hypothetical protein